MFKAAVRHGLPPTKAAALQHVPQACRPPDKRDKTVESIFYFYYKSTQKIS